MLKTERLRLRRPVPADVAIAPALLGDPEVMRFLGGAPVPDDAVAAVVQKWLDDWDTYPVGKFVVERREDGAFVGRVGLNFFDTRTWLRSTASDAQPELGWAVVREHWGRGYATEAALAVRDWARPPHLISLIEPSNTRSARVAERLGARPTETVRLPDGGDHVVWVHP